MLRVRTAAATSMEARSITSGGLSVSVWSFHSTATPIERSTSSKRLTSSILGTLWRVVVPFVSNDAASSATAPFLERLVSMVPLSGVPPTTAKFFSSFVIAVYSTCTDGYPQ